MAREKAPAYQWYPKDWQTDEAARLMTYEQKGVYRELLDHQWLEGSIPADAHARAKLLGMPYARLERLWPALAIKFAPNGDPARLVNPRLERQRREQAVYQEVKAAAGRKSAAVRRQRTGSAQPNSARTAPEQPVRKSVRTAPEPSSSSSSSSSATAVRTGVQNTPVARATKPPDPHVKEFLVWFQSEYTIRRHGADYLVKWDRDGALVKQMLGATPMDRLKRLAQIMLSDKCSDEFIVESGRDLTILSAKFNWLSDRLAEWEATRAQA